MERHQREGDAIQQGHLWDMRGRNEFCLPMGSKRNSAKLGGVETFISSRLVETLFTLLFSFHRHPVDPNDDVDRMQKNKNMLSLSYNWAPNCD